MPKVLWCKNGDITMTLEMKDGKYIVHQGNKHLIVSEKVAFKIKNLNYQSALIEIEKEINNER